MDTKFKPEIFQQRTPCTECPFRRDSGVRHSLDMMASYIGYFVTFPGATFPCHKSVPKSDDRSQWSEWQDGQVLCAGGMIFAAKVGEMNLFMSAAIQRGWYDPARHSEADRACVFDTVEEMLATSTEDTDG